MNSKELIKQAEKSLTKEFEQLCSVQLTDKCFSYSKMLPEEYENEDIIWIWLFFIFAFVILMISLVFGK